MPIYALDGVTPELDADCWIAPDAVVLGRVRLLKGASIWFGAVLRGDNDWITVGENSNVQDLSVIHSDPGQPVDIGTGDHRWPPVIIRAFRHHWRQRADRNGFGTAQRRAHRQQFAGRRRRPGDGRQAI